MNNKISPASFFENFVGQDAEPSRPTSWINKNTLRALALTAAAVLSGCATTGTAYKEVEANNSNLASQGAEIIQLKELNSQNFKEVINNHESGVYKDPYETENIVTYQFYQDSNAEETIIQDMKNHGLDPDSYHWQKKLIDNHNESIGRSNINSIINKGNYSQHAQDPYGIGDDINLSMIDHDENGFGVDELIEEYPQFSDYSSYMVMMHETAHGFEHQQMSLLDMGISNFSKTKFVEMENSSDFAGMVMTLQLMNDNNESLETMNVFLDSITDLRQSKEQGKKHSKFFKTNDPSVIHATSMTLKLVKHMLNENPENILGMDKSLIAKGAEIVSSMIVQHDFTEDVTMDIIDKNSEKLNNSTNILKNLQDKMHNDYQGFREQVDKINNKFSDKSVVGYLFTHIDENENAFGNYDEQKLKSLVIGAMAREISGDNGLSILEREDLKKMVKYDVESLPILGGKVLNEMYDQGIVESIEISTTQDHVDLGYSNDEMGARY